MAAAGKFSLENILSNIEDDFSGRIRNRGCVPYIEGEGVFLRPLTNIEYKKDTCFSPDGSPFQRLYMHQTLASARRYAHFKHFE